MFLLFFYTFQINMIFIILTINICFSFLMSVFVFLEISTLDFMLVFAGNLYNKTPGLDDIFK